MSGYIKIPDCHRDMKEVIYIDKEFEEIYECDTNEELHPKPRGVIAACGTQARNIDFGIEEIELPVEIARVTIDTSCLCNPLVVIDFCSIVTLNFDVQAATFVLSLSKECEGISKHTIDTFEFRRDDTDTSDSFCFDFCDFNNSCTGCCSYIVEITFASVTRGDAGLATIGQGVITANAQGACSD
ncbi:DUF4489 domain-containing protein [Wukongibacter baidiensis]|uniref:DUF4489 domain-containing protein n=1 Tax=Wukongibacter baidiensis TaxID=1723361 RepID=UPI003D7F93D1